jgi:hypothetical protein
VDLLQLSRCPHLQLLLTDREACEHARYLDRGPHSGGRHLRARTQTVLKNNPLPSLVRICARDYGHSLRCRR